MKFIQMFRQSDDKLRGTFPLNDDIVKGIVLSAGGLEPGETLSSTCASTMAKILAGGRIDTKISYYKLKVD